MATAYIADSYIQPTPESPVAGTVFVVNFRFTPTTVFIINDTVSLFTIPGGCTLVDYMVELPQYDTGTTVSWSLGDTGGTAGAFQAQYVATAAVSRTNSVLDPIMCFNGTTAVAPVRAALPANYAVVSPNSPLTMQLKVITAPGTAAGTTAKMVGSFMFIRNGYAPLV